MSQRKGEEWPYSIINTADDVQFPVSLKFVGRAIGGPGVDLSLAELAVGGCNCQTEDQCCSSVDDQGSSGRNGRHCTSPHTSPTAAQSEGTAVATTSPPRENALNSGDPVTLQRCSCSSQYGPVCDQSGRLLQPDCLERPLLECGSNCGCPLSCQNRFVQRNAQGACSMEIYRHSSRGWSVRSLVSIRAHTFICEYAGLVLRERDARRIESERGAMPNYLLVLREHRNDGTVLKTHIDASTCGNASRFFNHSCEPNLEMRPVRAGSIVARLAFFALKDIPPGADLTWSYGNEAKPGMAQAAANYIKCLCGSEHCAGFLPYDESAFMQPLTDATN